MSDAARTSIARPVRDLLATGLVLAGWAFIDQDWNIAMQVALAVITTAAAFLVHEWAHWLAGRLAGARMRLNTRIGSVFLFTFDSRNSIRQFQWMSAGGLIGSAILVAFMTVFLPRSILATWVTFALTGIGVLITFVVELPELVTVSRSGRYPESFAYEHADHDEQIVGRPKPPHP